MTISVTRWTLAGVALLAAACSAGDGDAPRPADVASPTATAVTAPVATAAATQAPPGAGADAGAALLAIMRGGGEDPFAVPPDALPGALLALLDELGVDLLLGAALSKQDGGVTVTAVFPGSPAERGGLLVGDAVLAVGGVDLDSAGDLRVAVWSTAPGDVYALDVRRSDRSLSLSVEREADAVAEWRSALLNSLALGLLMGDGATSGSHSLLGEIVAETPDGLIVTSVFPTSPADTAGLRAGDILLAVDGHALTSIDDHNALLESPGPVGSEISVVVSRNGAELTLLAVVAPRR